MTRHIVTDGEDDAPVDSSQLRTRLARFRYSDSASPTSRPIPGPSLSPQTLRTSPRKRQQGSRTGTGGKAALHSPQSPYFGRKLAASSSDGSTSSAGESSYSSSSSSSSSSSNSTATSNSNGLRAADNAEDMELFNDMPSPSKKQRKNDSASRKAKQPCSSEQPKKKNKKKPARPYADPSQYAHLDPLTEQLRPGLNVVTCGINPGQKSAATNTHYAHPTNHFWTCVHRGGFTDRQLTPLEGRDIINIASMGMTNLCARPTAEASELSAQEMRESAPVFLRKMMVHQPKVVAFAGMQICDIVRRYLHTLPPLDQSVGARARLASRSDSPALNPGSSNQSQTSPQKTSRRSAMSKTVCGLQPFTLSYPSPGALSREDRSYIYFVCLPSPSARVTSYQLKDKIQEFRKLKTLVDVLTSATPSPRLDFPPGTRVEDFPIDELDQRIRATEHGSGLEQDRSAVDQPAAARVKQEVVLDELQEPHQPESVSTLHEQDPRPMSSCWVDIKPRIKKER